VGRGSCNIDHPAGFYDLPVCASDYVDTGGNMRRNEPSGIAIHHGWLTFAVHDGVKERQAALIIAKVLVVRM
jgi:hypothetical protein